MSLIIIPIIITREEANFTGNIDIGEHKVEDTNEECSHLLSSV